MSFHRVDQPLSHLTVSGENVAVRRNSSYASLSTVVDNLIDELRSNLKNVGIKKSERFHFNTFKFRTKSLASQ